MSSVAHASQKGAKRDEKTHELMCKCCCTPLSLTGKVEVKATYMKRGAAFLKHWFARTLQ